MRKPAPIDACQGHPVLVCAEMKSPTQAETDAYLDEAVRLARGAGAMIAEAFAKAPAGYDRKSLTDPVTETDRAVEAYLFGQLRAAFPSHLFIGEESASEAALTDAPTWIVDVS